MDTDSALLPAALTTASYLAPPVIAYFIKPRTRFGNFLRWFFGIGMMFALVSLSNSGWNEGGIVAGAISLVVFGLIAGLMGALFFKPRKEAP